ncbi:hypothetical protein WMF28_26110 [Sorangium sp. So ce590]|uniref:hypothetical protein n=1 Tax=Sorangium sp. So ce590 TaxID=3133317 RepID=UPI003F61FEF2
MSALPKGPTNSILMNLQGISDPNGYTLRMRKRYGDPMSLPKMDGKPVLATGSVEGLRALFRGRAGCARPGACAASSIRSSPAAAPSPPSAPIS